MAGVAAMVGHARPVFLRFEKGGKMVATAGGVLFAGALDRYFTAYDSANGKALWKSRLPDVPSAAPITYSVNGRQYVAMVVGYGSPQTMTFPMLTPEIDLPITSARA